MPKLRHGDTDVAMFTQWIGRKCRNHNPLSELFATNRTSLPDMYMDKSRTKPRVGVMDQDRNVLFYAVGSRTFKIEVSEVETPPKKRALAPVGY